jgi:hypothetical protein
MRLKAECESSPEVGSCGSRRAKNAVRARGNASGGNYYVEQHDRRVGQQLARDVGSLLLAPRKAPLQIISNN